MGSGVIFRGQSLFFVVPGPLASRTGGYIYDARIVDGLRRLGASVCVLELEGAFPFPSDAALTDAARALSTAPDDATVVIDGLALGAMPDVVEREADRLRIVALMHLPLAADVTRDADAAASLADKEARALAAARLVILTSEATVPLLARYAVPRDRIAVVEPGTERSPLAHGSDGSSLNLLCVATLNAGKGHEILLRALARVAERNWRLTCAGSLTRDAACAARVRATIADLRLEDRVTLAGELDEAGMANRYAHADLFVLATLQETYGMAVAEALAHGLPVVSTTTGAIPRLVGDDAGVLVAPGDVEGLADALTRVMGDASFRRRLAAGARRVRDRLPTWEEASARFAAALGIEQPSQIADTPRHRGTEA